MHLSTVPCIYSIQKPFSFIHKMQSFLFIVYTYSFIMFLVEPQSKEMQHVVFVYLIVGGIKNAQSRVTNYHLYFVITVPHAKRPLKQHSFFIFCLYLLYNISKCCYCSYFGTAAHQREITKTKTMSLMLRDRVVHKFHLVICFLLLLF